MAFSVPLEVYSGLHLPKHCPLSVFFFSVSGQGGLSGEIYHWKIVVVMDGVIKYAVHIILLRCLI